MKQSIRLNESELKGLIKSVIKEHLNDMQLGEHNITPEIALAQYLRISPKNIKKTFENEFEVKSNKGDFQTWNVFSSYKEAENYARQTGPDFCDGAAPDDYWFNAGYEKTMNGEFDWDKIANDIVDSEGPEWFFASYDGCVRELPDGYVGFRCD